MWIYVYFGALTCSMLTAKATSYSLSKDKNNWANPPCKLAVPKLKYSIGNGWKVDELQLQVPQEGLWVGLINAVVAFDYLGCSSAAKHGTTVVRDISDCHLLCQGRAFGIQKTGSKDTIRCWCWYTNAKLSEKSCSVLCGKNEGCLCGNENTNIFAIYDSTHVEATQSYDESAVCLGFNYPYFNWRECKGQYNQLLCSNLKDGFAEIQVNTFKNTWWDANEQCLSLNKFPATAESVRQSNKTWDNQQKLDHWTGVIRTRAVLYAENKDLITSSFIKYAFIKSDGSIAFETGGYRHSLCEDLEDPGEENEQKRGNAAVGIAVGVSVAVIVVIACIVLIYKCRTRVTKCCEYTSDSIPSTNKHGIVEQSQELTTVETNENIDTGAGQTYFVLEKPINTIHENTRNFGSHSGPIIPAQEITQETDYSEINDMEEPYDNIRVDTYEYDYTNNLPTSAHVSTNPDNVYNKLKFEQQGDYDHIKEQKHVSIFTSNDDYAVRIHEAANANMNNDNVKGRSQCLNISNHEKVVAQLATNTRNACAEGDYDHLKTY